jgi:hypothetical protein
MPPLWCRLDRMWFGHPGVMEGTMTRQPFLCPMDHVFEVITQEAKIFFHNLLIFIYILSGGISYPLFILYALC